jgi:hypothetical protein
MDTRLRQLAQINHVLNNERETLQFALARLEDIAYETSELNGWHDKPRPISEVLILIVTEVAELYEEVRNGVVPEDGMRMLPANQDIGETMDKPEGIVIELADIVIRCFDAAGEWHLDLGGALIDKLIYNTTRSYRHGGKTA